MKRPFTESTDDTMMEAIRADNQLAFRQLFQKYWSPLYAICFYHLEDKTACSEIVHDIFLQIWEKRHTQTVESLPAYISAAARYQVYKRYRKAAAAIHHVDTESVEAEIKDENSGEYSLRYKELELKVEGHLEALPPRCREIFRLSRFQHLSNEEIANKLEISQRTVENQITRALQHLRENLGDLMLGLILIYMNL